jgi:DNA polymerase III delta subunit
MAPVEAARLYLLAEERRGEFDAYRADLAIADIRRMLEAADAAIATLGYHAADCDVEAVADAIETPSLFGARTLVTLRGAETLGEREQERLTQALERQAPQVTVVIVARGADMRRRLFARCRELGRRISVDHPRAGELRDWAERLARVRGLRLEAAACSLLLDCVGRDLLILASELDKLAAAVSEARAITAGDVLRITAAGREHGSFEMTDALCARAAAAATRLLAQTLDEGMQPVAVVGAIAAALKPILAGAELVAQGRGVDEAERALGVNFYQRRAFQRGVRAYRPRELRRALIGLADLDLAIKTGAGHGRSLLEQWLLRLCLGGRPATGARTFTARA